MAIELTYERLVRHHVPGPRSISYFLPILLLPLALLIPPSKASKQQLCAVLLPIITATLLHAWIAMGGVDVISVDLLLFSYDILLFKDPRKDFSRIILKRTSKEAANKENGTKGTKTVKNGTLTINGHAKSEFQQQISHGYSGTTGSYTEQAYPMDFNERLSWVGSLFSSLRFTNWKINTPSHDRQQPSPPTGHSHFRFIIYAILRTFLGYTILDLTTAYTHHDPYFRKLDQSIDSPLPLPSQTLPGILSSICHLPIPVSPRLLRSSIIALQAWATVSQQFHLPCAIPVFLHYLGLISDTWSPHLWPSFFGSFTSIFISSSNISPLRNFWGRYWHQMLRHYCSGPGVYVSDKLGLSRDSGLRYTLIVTATFFWSGVVHVGMVPPEPLRASISANGIRLLVAAFFWLQPVGLALEALASTVLRRVRLPRWVVVVVSVIWFVAWSCVVLPLIGEAGRQLGYWNVWPVPVSLWRGLLYDEWVTWTWLK